MMRQFTPFFLHTTISFLYFLFLTKQKGDGHTINWNSNIAPLAFAAGSGFGSTSKKTTSSEKKITKKRKGKISDLIQDDTIKQSSNKSIIENNKDDDTPKLDRFGLPVVTADNFFPNLPHDTEIIPMDGDSNKSIIRESMAKHLSINLDIFDEDGIEKEEYCLGREPWVLKLLHRSPPVLSVENFFTPEDCKEYINFTKDSTTETTTTANKNEKSSLKSLEVNSATFSALAYSKRTSTTWYCYYSQVPTLLAKAKRLLNDLPLNQMEEAQIVRYRTGEQFSWHYDEIPSSQLFNGGQRIATLLVYLNSIDADKGGGTIFRDLKSSSVTAGGGSGELTMRPKLGSALLFFPAFADGTPDDRTLHKGEVAIDEKMIAQIWVHERGYSPVIPEGNSHEDAIEKVSQKEIELGYTIK